MALDMAAGCSMNRPTSKMSNWIVFFSLSCFLLLVFSWFFSFARWFYFGYCRSFTPYFSFTCWCSFSRHLSFYTSILLCLFPSLYFFSLCLFTSLPLSLAVSFILCLSHSLSLSFYSSFARWPFPPLPIFSRAFFNKIVMVAEGVKKIWYNCSNDVETKRHSLGEHFKKVLVKFTFIF